MKNLCEGLTQEQEAYITKELGVYVKERHQALAKLFRQHPEDEEVQMKAIAWEFVCQHIGLSGYDWS